MAADSLRTDAAQDEIFKILDALLSDFGLSRTQTRSKVVLIGEVPSIEETKSHKLLLSLAGALPSLANAVAAAQIYESRGGEAQTISVDLRKGHNYIDPDIGMTPSINGQEITKDLVAGNPFLRGFYKTKDGRYVVPSAVYVDLVYQWSAFLGTSLLESDVADKIAQWHSKDLEDLCAKVGMPLAIIRSEDEWKTSVPGKYLMSVPIVPVRKINSSPARPLSPNPKRPLEGVRVLCMTHAIAGPSAGRTLAEHGASVLQIMYTHGLEHQFVWTAANLGCNSARLNLAKEQDRQRLWQLVRDADVWIDSYREGGVSKFGFADEHLFEANPSLIVSHVRVYGHDSPWKERPGFDMQGSAISGMMAHCGDGPEAPQWPPGMVINDYTTGYYGALAIQATLLRRAKKGGGYVLSPSLAGTATSIMKHLKTKNHPSLIHSSEKPLPPDTVEGMTNVGYLKTLKPLPQMSETPTRYDPILLRGLGSDPPVFPGYYNYDVRQVQPVSHETLQKELSGLKYKMERLHSAVESSSKLR